MKKFKDKYLARGILFATVLLLSVVTISQMQINHSKAGVNLVNNTSAKVVTWVEQNWKQKWFGNGFWQTRTLYSVNPSAANTKKVYENRKLVLSTTNNTKVAQTAGYSYSVTTGHVVSASVSAKSEHFEAAVGYSFSYAVTKEYSASLNVPAKSSVTCYSSDVRIKSQYTTYNAQPQRGSLSGWINYGTATSSRPLIKEYAGNHFEWCND